MSFDPFGITGDVIITLLLFFLSIYARRIKRGSGSGSFWKNKAAQEKALIEQNLMIALYHNDPDFDIINFTTRVEQNPSKSSSARTVGPTSASTTLAGASTAVEN